MFIYPYPATPTSHVSLATRFAIALSFSSLRISCSLTARSTVLIGSSDPSTRAALRLDGLVKLDGLVLLAGERLAPILSLFLFARKVLRYSRPARTRSSGVRSRSSEDVGALLVRVRVREEREAEAVEGVYGDGGDLGSAKGLEKKVLLSMV